MKLLPLVIYVAACGPTSNRPADATTAVDGAAPDVATAQDAAVASGPVHVVITADNAYSFGYGDSASITNFTQGTRAQTAGEIFNCPIGVGPEAYDVPAAAAPDGAYLYIVAWDDLEVTQGVLAQFTRDTGTVLTGDSRFEVCATGLDYSTGPDAQVGPDLATINTEIARCNAGTGATTTTSAGWVNVAGPTSTPNAIGKLAVGETNDDNGGTFPIVCQPTMGMDGIVANAQWMWYWLDDGSTPDAFHSTGVNTFRAFLIFRLGANTIIE